MMPAPSATITVDMGRVGWGGFVDDLTTCDTKPWIICVNLDIYRPSVWTFATNAHFGNAIAILVSIIATYLTAWWNWCAIQLFVFVACDPTCVAGILRRLNKAGDVVEVVDEPVAIVVDPVAIFGFGCVTIGRLVGFARGHLLEATCPNANRSTRSVPTPTLFTKRPILIYQPIAIIIHPIAQLFPTRPRRVRAKPPHNHNEHRNENNQLTHVKPPGMVLIDQPSP